MLQKQGCEISKVTMLLDENDVLLTVCVAIVFIPL